MKYIGDRFLSREGVSYKFKLDFDTDDDRSSYDEEKFQLRFQGFNFYQKSNSFNFQFLSDSVNFKFGCDQVAYIPVPYPLDFKLDIQGKIIVPVYVNNVLEVTQFNLHFESIDRFVLTQEDQMDPLYVIKFQGAVCGVMDLKSKCQVLHLFRKRNSYSLGTLEFTKKVAFPENIAIVLSVGFLLWCQKFFVSKVCTTRNVNLNGYRLGDEYRVRDHYKYGEYFAACLGPTYLERWKNGNIDDEFLNELSLRSLGHNLLKGYKVSEDLAFEI